MLSQKDQKSASWLRIHAYLPMSLSLAKKRLNPIDNYPRLGETLDNFGSRDSG
jgi:hypothetical protein